MKFDFKQRQTVRYPWQNYKPIVAVFDTPQSEEIEIKPCQNYKPIVAVFDTPQSEEIDFKQRQTVRYPQPAH